jgi:hypothetical protein
LNLLLKLILLVLLTVAIIVGGAYLYFDVFSIWSSPGKVKTWILQITPLGTPLTEVDKIIKLRQWKEGYSRSFEYSAWSSGLFPNVPGAHAIGVNFGNHGNPFSYPDYYGVIVYWGFDSSDKLADVKVNITPRSWLLNF